MSESLQESSVIKRDAERFDFAMEYIQVLNPVLDQVREDQSIKDQIYSCLTMNPEDIDSLNLRQIDKYLLLIPKALIWLQECENLARIAKEDAENAYEDTIQTKAALLDKSHFTISPINEKMRIAKIREMFPKEYDARVKELRTTSAILIRLSGQTKHLERLNDNIKKIRESFVFKVKNDRGED